MAETLKQLIMDGKIESCINWIEEYLETNGKLVVGLHHTKIADKIFNKFRNHTIRITGGLGANEKDKRAYCWVNKTVRN